MSNIEYYQSEIERYKEQIEREKQNLVKEEEEKSLKECAEKSYAIYKAFLDAGFSEEQAWYLAGNIIYKAIEAVC